MTVCDSGEIFVSLVIVHDCLIFSFFFLSICLRFPAIRGLNLRVASGSVFPYLTVELAPIHANASSAVIRTVGCERILCGDS